MARRRNPYPALVVAALIPALALGALWQFATGKKPDAVNVSVTPPTVDSSLPPAVPVLTTPILSVRRAPSVLAREVNDAAFKEALQPFADDIDSTSCFAVSVDGEPVVAVHEALALRPGSTVKLKVRFSPLTTLRARLRTMTRHCPAWDGCAFVSV